MKAMNKYIKHTITSTLFLSLFLFSPAILISYAQTASGCAPIKVGNPPANEVLPPMCGGGTGATGPCGAVIDWDQKINDALVIGGGGSLSGEGYDNLSKDIVSTCGKSSPRSSWAGQYWCTYSIVDSYTLAGFKGLSIGKLGMVVNMRSWWKTASGYKYVDYASPGLQLKSVGPGYAMMMESVAGVNTSHEHVNMVKTIKVDARGNGSLTTLDSNSGSKGHTNAISSWQIQNTAYPVRGFGGH
jgi:hypothetical protein